MKALSPLFIAIAISILLIQHSTLAQKIEDSVVLIKAQKEYSEITGAGIIIGYDDRCHYILTAYHVVQDAKSCTIELYGPGQSPIPANLTRNIDRNKDIAILVAEIPPYDITYNKLKESKRKKLKKDAKIGVLGHPFDDIWQYNELNQLLPAEDIEKLKFTDRFIDRGNSGGPILLPSNKHIVGMVTRTQGQGAEGIKIKNVLWYLDNWGVPMNLIKRPTRKSTMILGASSIVLGAVGYKFNQDGTKNYDIYQVYRDPDALEEKFGLSQDALFKKAKTDYTFRSVAYSLSIATLISAVLIEMDVFEKKNRSNYKPCISFNGAMSSYGISINF